MSAIQSSPEELSTEARLIVGEGAELPQGAEAPRRRDANRLATTVGRPFATVAPASAEH